MSKLGIITFLHNENYGSTLQAWALQTVLREQGFDAVHIDYRPDRKEKIRNLVRSGNSPTLLLDGVKKRKVKAGQAGARSKAASFDDFYRRHMQLTSICRTHSALFDAAKGMDGLVCGSDQVWSPVWFNPAYYLDFAGEKPRVSYACSLGVSQMTNPVKAKRIAGLLKPFSAVSVREEEGAALIRSLCDKEVTVLPDPVVLPDRDAWLKLAEPYQAERPYIACYFIGDRQDYWDTVRDLQTRTGLDVVVIPVTGNAFQQGYTLAEGLSPTQWLGVLSGASHVVTDSFHGTVFSLLLERPFTILRRYSEKDRKSKNSRIDNLLRQVGLAGATGCEHPEQCRDRLEDLRRTGKDWLISSLHQAGL